MFKKIHYLFVLCLLAVLSTPSAVAGNKYGFAYLKTCPLFSTPYPIGFRKAFSGMKKYQSTDLAVNVLYIPADNTVNIDEYAALYSVNSTLRWPGNNESLFIGNDIAACQNTGSCQDSAGVEGKGISAIASLKKEFSGEKIYVASEFIDPVGEKSDSFTWFYLPVRYFKLLRIELFIPNDLDDGASSSEPFFIEYRAKGERGNMARTSSGGTAKGANFNGIKLPETLNLTQSSAMRFWLSHSTSSPADDISDLLPYADTVALNSTQQGLIPEGCK